MESLIARLVQFSCAIVIFFFLEGALGTGHWALGYAQFWDFPEISLFSMILNLKPFGNLRDNSYIADSNLASLHLWCMEIMLKYRKCLRYSVRDFKSKSKVLPFVELSYRDVLVLVQTSTLGQSIQEWTK